MSRGRNADKAVRSRSSSSNSRRRSVSRSLSENKKEGESPRKVDATGSGSSNVALDGKSEKHVVEPRRKGSFVLPRILKLSLSRGLSSFNDERYSLLDPNVLESTQSPFRGFLYFLWLCMIAGLVSAASHNHRLHGYYISDKLWRLMMVDIDVYLLAEVLLISCSFIAFGIQKLLVLKIISLNAFYVISHVFQAFYVISGMGFSYYRRWPFPQTIVFTLHTVSMYMKIHSYLSNNGKLHRHWLSERRKKYDNNDSEAVGNYPSNVTAINFFQFLLIPSLVYLPIFPRSSSKIRWIMLLEKGFSAMLAFCILYLVVQQWMLPTLFELEHLSLIAAIGELLLPFVVFYIIGFYITFECICNWFAEVTRYSDRNFYEDWWNSSTFDEFARKWNKPVHRFLYHHVYLEAIENYEVSKRIASFLTFLFSSLLHEFVLTVICRRVQIYLFYLQMAQVPLIWIGQKPWVRQHRLLSNLFFWSSMLVGPPLLAILYCRQYFTTTDWRADFANWDAL